MMIQEFIERTGFEPMPEEYAEIEEAYYAFNGDKDSFCRDFVANGGEKKIYQHRAERIQQLHSKQIEMEKDFMATIQRQQNEIERLQKELDQEQGWKPYEEEHNVRQAEYDRLASSAGPMTDQEAIKLVSEWIGFREDCIKIIRAVPEYQINRNNKLRKSGRMIDRSPLYDATDWNYIRFDVKAETAVRSYELFNDELRPYWE